MNTLLIKTALSAAIALTIAGCGSSGGGGGGSTAGIGGSGFVSSGSITGFGSVFVNGVKFDVNGATFDVDGDMDAMEGALAIGMIVKVNGSIDGDTGIATSISYDEELQGPISAVTPPDSVKRSLTILGDTVFVDSSSTTFDVDSLLADTTFNINTIAVNNVVEVSGFFDSNGDLQATRIELKDIIFDPNSIVEVEGVIKNYIDDSNFMVGNVFVDASSPSVIDGLNVLQNGLLVEVIGTYDAGTNTVKANKVEGEDNLVANTDEFEIEGLITKLNGTTFNLGDLIVDASGAIIEPFALSLENDMRVEVEGKVLGGVLTATKIELEGGDLKVHAEIKEVFSNTFEVVPNPLTGQVITVTVASGTQIEDDVNGLEELTLSDLMATDFVEIRGFNDGSDGILATEVSVKLESDVLVQGEATAATGDAASGGTITVLGVTFDFDAVTDFEDVDESNMIDVQINALISDISAAPVLVKIEDNQSGTGGNPVGTADAIDVE